MDMPSIGAHCSVSSCNVNDFLPIRCKCEHLFCKDHILPESHSCPVDPSARDSVIPFPRLHRCAAVNCSKPSLDSYVSDSADVVGRTPAVCVRCQLSFCAVHRDAKAHSCAAIDPSATSSTNETARAMLAKYFPPVSGSTKTPRSSKPSVNPKKAAQLCQVELMKMRHHAQPGDPKDKGSSVLLEQRIHLMIRRADDNLPERSFWFRKTIGTGRVIDLLASHFALSISDSSPLYLAKNMPNEGGPEHLRTDLLLSAQVEDGSHLLLTRKV
ncbi:AN1-type zinc finger protein 1 [Grifola frondosa]|uniref:AN1-type zinc finger protein 1 n=1 Tax=Grifola frondosa TaxID=5627 RepID=A0A1C7MKB6_GRIFR|nr:AN1-type zinc finger protein 1 [Grifola frondosa]